MYNKIIYLTYSGIVVNIIIKQKIKANLSKDGGAKLEVYGTRYYDGSAAKMFGSFLLYIYSP